MLLEKNIAPLIDKTHSSLLLLLAFSLFFYLIYRRIALVHKATRNQWLSRVAKRREHGLT